MTHKPEQNGKLLRESTTKPKVETEVGPVHTSVNNRQGDSVPIVSCLPPPPSRHCAAVSVDNTWMTPL